MPGASLSRWTMSYFAAACLFLLAGEGLLAVGYGNPVAGISGGDVLAVVHLITAGWLGLLMSGALLQFVPVLAAKPLRAGNLALPALVAILAGEVGLVSGFALIASGMAVSEHLLACGAVLLAVGYLGVAVMVVRTFLDARPLPLAGRFVALGIVGLIGTLCLGVFMALGLSALLPGELLALVTDILPLHVIFGLGGWLTLSALGVSYKLLPMFLLAGEPSGGRPNTVLLGAASALVLLLLLVLLTVLDISGVFAALLLGIVTGISLLLYGLDLSAILKARRRREMELNSIGSLAAFLWLFIAFVWLAVAFLLGRLEEQAPAIVYLAGFGWLTGLGLAQLYKIVPFLTWLECYGPVLGRVPTPRVQDIVRERRARLWFLAFHAGVSVATLALALGLSFLFRAGVFLQFGATLALVLEFLRARRLADVDAVLRLPKGTIRPYLFLPSPDIRR